MRPRLVDSGRVVGGDQAIVGPLRPRIGECRTGRQLLEVNEGGIVRGTVLEKLM